MTDTRLPAEIEAAIRKHAQSRATDDCATCEAQNDPTNDMLRGAAFLYARLSQMGPEFDKRSIQLAFSKHVMAHPKQPQEPAWMWECGAKAQFEQTQAQVVALQLQYIEKSGIWLKTCQAADTEIERLRADLSEACAARDQWRTTEIENKRLKRELATLKDFFCNAVPNNVYQAALDRAAKERK